MNWTQEDLLREVLYTKQDTVPVSVEVCEAGFSYHNFVCNRDIVHALRIDLGYIEYENSVRRIDADGNFYVTFESTDL